MALDPFFLAGFVVAALLAALLWAPRPPGLGWVGALLMAYPLGRALAYAAEVAPRVLANPVLQPVSAQALLLQVVHDLSFGLLLPLGGALLRWRHRATGRVHDARDAVAAARAALLPAGVGRGAAGRDAALDALALLGVTLLLLLLGLALGGVVPGLGMANESAVWANLTLPLLLALSLAAAVSEEFVYRGLLLRALERRVAGWAALLIQALAFGFIHSGYGNLAHVLGPLLFALLMGLVAQRVGLLACVAVHAGIDIAYLALAAPQLQPWSLALPGLLALAGLASLALTRGRAVRAVLARAPSRA
ncbi:MAG: CPBP family intramembrane metalloprotease [Halobacteriales archaeon]|nr:CPBP family intramembrane metalloprotease [Halobacteriales archaeon]